MQVSIRGEIRGVLRDFRDLRDKDVKYALKNAINDTAFEMRKVLGGDMQGTFDRPTSFTTNPSAWDVAKAQVSRPSATIRLKGIQASYLKWQAYGGTRMPNKKAIPIPQEGGAAISRAHGGLKRQWRKILDDKSRYFSGAPKGGGRPGVYRRLGVSKSTPSGKKIRLELAWEKSAKYERRWRYEESAYRYIGRAFEANFRKRLLASRAYRAAR
jgi:hypothetical protein